MGHPEHSKESSTEVGYEILCCAFFSLLMSGNGSISGVGKSADRLTLLSQIAHNERVAVVSYADLVDLVDFLRNRQRWLLSAMVSYG